MLDQTLKCMHREASDRSELALIHLLEKCLRLVECIGLGRGVIENGLLDFLVFGSTCIEAAELLTGYRAEKRGGHVDEGRGKEDCPRCKMQDSSRNDEWDVGIICCLYKVYT